MGFELVLEFTHSIGLDYKFNLGAVAQLGERLICIQEVAGSIPTSSTSLGNACSLEAQAGCLSPQRKGANKRLWSGPVAQVARAHP